MSVMANRCKREQAAEVTAIKTVERVLSGAVSKVLAQLNDLPLCGSSNINSANSASSSGAGVRNRKRKLLQSTLDFDSDEEETSEKKLKT